MKMKMRILILNPDNYDVYEATPFFGGKWVAPKITPPP